MPESMMDAMGICRLRREIEGEWRCPRSGDERGMEEENQGEIGGVIWEPFPL
jgi:hypothetical protein